MPSSIAGIPTSELYWYGLASLGFLLCFSSLSYEVQAGLHACEKADDEEAWRITWTTYQVNFVVMITTHLLFIAALVGAYVADGDNARLCLAAAIFLGGSYWIYTRACEKKLIVFLKNIGIHPPSYPLSSLGKLFRRR